MLRDEVRHVCRHLSNTSAWLENVSVPDCTSPTCVRVMMGRASSHRRLMLEATAHAGLKVATALEIHATSRARVPRRCTRLVAAPGRQHVAPLADEACAAGAVFRSAPPPPLSPLSLPTILICHLELALLRVQARLGLLWRGGARRGVAGVLAAVGGRVRNRRPAERQHVAQAALGTHVPRSRH
jgi:hypothetical protein